VNVKFCRGCRALILSDFRFCPYCGAEAPRGPGIEEALERPFAEMGARVFDGAAESLARLEADMDRIIEALEREGRSSP
jgi:hypothetical protein